MLAGEPLPSTPFVKHLCVALRSRLYGDGRVGFEIRGGVSANKRLLLGSAVGPLVDGGWAGRGGNGGFAGPGRGRAASQRPQADVPAGFGALAGGRGREGEG